MTRKKIEDSFVFNVASDTEYVVNLPSDAETNPKKTLDTLATIVCNALLKQGVPDVGLQFHELKPMKVRGPVGISSLGSFNSAVLYH